MVALEFVEDAESGGGGGDEKESRKKLNANINISRHSFACREWFLLHDIFYTGYTNLDEVKFTIFRRLQLKLVPEV